MSQSRTKRKLLRLGVPDIPQELDRDKYSNNLQGCGCFVGPLRCHSSVIGNTEIVPGREETKRTIGHKAREEYK